MRFPRLRITVRRTFALTAAVAFGLFIASEIRDGMPPRFVLRGIPSRIDRLRPGMTKRQTLEILGLGKSWLLGGTGGTSGYLHGNGHFETIVYYIRPTRVVMRTASVGDNPPAPIAFHQSTAVIQLEFSTSDESDSPETTLLTSASYSCDSTVLAEMPEND